MTAVAERPAAVDCMDCGQSMPVAAFGYLPRYCKPCKRRHKEYAARNAQARIDSRMTTIEAELGGQVANLRLRIEAAKPAARLALMASTTSAKDALLRVVLAELEGTPRIADLRRIVALP